MAGLLDAISIVAVYGRDQQEDATITSEVVRNLYLYHYLCLELEVLSISDHHYYIARANSFKRDEQEAIKASLCML